MGMPIMPPDVWWRTKQNQSMGVTDHFPLFRCFCIFLFEYACSLIGRWLLNRRTFFPSPGQMFSLGLTLPIVPAKHTLLSNFTLASILASIGWCTLIFDSCPGWGFHALVPICLIFLDTSHFYVTVISLLCLECLLSSLNSSDSLRTKAWPHLHEVFLGMTWLLCNLSS